MTLATREQIETALKLAAAHGHAWAYREAVLDALTDDGRHVNLDRLYEIVAMAHEDDDTPIEGIYSPELDGEGRIVHRTQSGRVRWTIDPDGTAVIEVRRPNPDDGYGVGEGYVVLRAVVPPYSHHIDVEVLPDQVYPRHVEAFAVALQAICYPHVWVSAILQVAPHVIGTTYIVDRRFGEGDPVPDGARPLVSVSVLTR